MVFIGQILILLLDILFWIVIAQVILSWLIAFDVVNIKNAQARNLIGLIHKITDPLYKPLRKFIPPIAGIDLTPIIIIFGIQLAKTGVAMLFFSGGF
jgi:YggT family protein